jgi:hypothetical protein
MDSPLGRAVLARHKPSTWNTTEPNRKVLQQLRCDEPEFDYVNDRILQTLKVKVDQVFRVENPYLYGEYIVQKYQPSKDSLDHITVLCFNCKGGNM